MADEKEIINQVVEEKNDNNNNIKKNKKKSKKKGVFSRIWNALFGLRGDDFEKRLQYISKEEDTLVSRMKRRSLRWTRIARNLIIFSVILELVAVGYAIMTTRGTVDMDWRMRSLRVLPMFLLPALSFGLHYGLSTFTKFCDRRDQKTLEKLRGERQAKIDELKERTNYYITQQLIQKYDPDPAAKAAAASVLASKLGADSGLKVFLADESQPDVHATGKSSDVDFQQTSGLRKRNQSNPRSHGSNPGQQFGKEAPQFGGNEVSGNSGQLVVEHQNPAASGAQDGGWIARIAALLVGEDPTQSYALICGNCHMHNGLARKEEFPFITYYCPHCHALNKPKNSVLPLTDKMSPVPGLPETASADVKLTEENNQSTGEKVSAASSPVEAFNTTKLHEYCEKVHAQNTLLRRNINFQIRLSGKWYCALKVSLIRLLYNKRLDYKHKESSRGTKIQNFVIRIAFCATHQIPKLGCLHIFSFDEVPTSSSQGYRALNTWEYPRQQWM